MPDELMAELEKFAREVALRAAYLRGNASLATPRGRAVLANLLTEGVRGFLKRGVPAETVRMALERAEKEVTD